MCVRQLCVYGFDSSRTNYLLLYTCLIIQMQIIRSLADEKEAKKDENATRFVHRNERKKKQIFSYK